MRSKMAGPFARKSTIKTRRRHLAKLRSKISSNKYTKCTRSS